MTIGSNKATWYIFSIIIIIVGIIGLVAAPVVGIIGIIVGFILLFSFRWAFRGT